ncbi:MAG: hypothetical protein HYX68_08140 [Planctomycetes bacterium]|nr:hypothetical protein [Planctomycetota bacterium]
MRICIYEDAGAGRLEPIALTRPVFALWCGAQRLFERQQRHFTAGDVGFWTRTEQAALWRMEQPGHPVNDAEWARAQSTAWINGRWLPSADCEPFSTDPHVGIAGKQIAYAVLPAGEHPNGEGIDAWFERWTARLSNRPAGGVMLDFLWDVVDQNAAAVAEDFHWFQAAHGSRPRPAQIAVTGPADRLVVAPGATIDPFVFADTRGGPVLIDRDAVVHSFSRLEGPCYVGQESWILGAKLRAGSSIGPCTRVGGEVEASIMQGFSNKYHDGFLGHSYVGEWVNLAAATQTSDLRNDYDVVRVSIDGQRIVTGKNKIGSYFGDHAKTGLGALLNTGSTVGPFANVLPAGALLPQVIPAFCLTQRGDLREITDLRKTFSTAARAMQRRGKTLTDTHRELYDWVFETTAERRRQFIREGEMRRLRKSV